MKADRRSGAAPAGGAQSLGRRAGRGRLSTVRADFFLDPRERLSERERALMSAMLHCLVDDIAARLRVEMHSEPVRDGEPNLVDALNRHGLLDEPDLIALLLLRAEEERIAAAASARAGRSETRLLQGLVGDDNDLVSAAAMALILARGRRRDRFGQCLLAYDDLPLPTAAALVHKVAAAVRSDGSLGDRAVTTASANVIAAHAPAKSIAMLTDALVGAMAEAEALDDATLLAAAHEGDIALLAHALAHSAGIDGSIAEAELVSGDPAAIIVLLRMAQIARPVAAGILASIGDLLGIDDPAAELARFADLGEAEVDRAHILLTSDREYRSALALLVATDG